MKRVRTKAQFIEKANQVHAFKYDYSRVVYVNSRQEVEIICPIHGVYLQRPTIHVTGHGCGKCAGTYRPTTAEFVEKAKQVHKNKYDYSKTIYKNNKSPINIICPEHGLFAQSASMHLRGVGCPLCGAGVLSEKQFIEKATKVHSGKYTYENIEYINMQKKINVTCPIHGVFKQRASSHIQGKGCLKCKNMPRITKDEFIERSRKKHGNKYKYDRVDYVDTYTKVEIVCPTHGSFMQAPFSHTSGSGCPLCSAFALKTTADFIIRANKRHMNSYEYTKTIYKRASANVTITCRTHGDFVQRAAHHLEGAGCPKCRSSHGERTINSWLTENNIIFEQQVRFMDCIDQLPLPFDFCIYNKDGTIKTLLEYDGELHYMPYRKTNQKALTLTQYHDAIKNQYCEDHKIPLIRIPYWDKDKIPEILQKQLGDDI